MLILPMLYCHTQHYNNMNQVPLPIILLSRKDIYNIDSSMVIFIRFIASWCSRYNVTFIVTHLCLILGKVGLRHFHNLHNHKLWKNKPYLTSHRVALPTIYITKDITSSNTLVTDFETMLWMQCLSLTQLIIPFFRLSSAFMLQTTIVSTIGLLVCFCVQVQTFFYGPEPSH